MPDRGSSAIGRAATYASGITLGEALTTSGAAVSSNMGPDASRRDDVPSDRLQRAAGRRGSAIPGCPATRPGRAQAPAFGVEPLVSELLARTTDTNPYVLLSPTAATSRTSASTRWCVAAAATSSSATPAATAATRSVIWRTRSGRSASISASRSTFPPALRIGPSRGGAFRRRQRFGIRRSIPTSRTACSCTSSRR